MIDYDYDYDYDYEGCLIRDRERFCVVPCSAISVLE